MHAVDPYWVGYCSVAARTAFPLTSRSYRRSLAAVCDDWTEKK